MTSSGPPPVTPESPWPLRGTREFDRLPISWRDATADALQRELVRHVIGPWFPRCIDREAGGFLSDFDSRWRARGRQDRMLEFQARQTRTAARLGLAFPSDSRWPEIAAHGLRYLRDRMGDREHGGWFRLVDRAGTPLAGATKHAHGTAYAIGACVEGFRLTGEQQWLAMAQEAFEWLERHLYDDIHGGYQGWATREGQVIRSAADAARTVPDAQQDPLGHGIGLKDINVHSDLAEAYAVLLPAWPDPRLRARLNELFDLVLQKFATPSGSMHYMTYQDFVPVPTIERFGYPLQVAARLPHAAVLLDRSRGAAVEPSRRLADHVWDRAWDERRGGGFIDAGPAAAPDMLTGYSLRVPVRHWWLQAEGLRMLLLLALNEARGDEYRSRFGRAHEFVRRHILDDRHRGWKMWPEADRPLRARLRQSTPPKANVWKDASHEADFYVTAIRMLRGLTEDAPIGG